MNIEQAHIEFQILLDKLATSQLPEFSPELIDYFLNTGSERFVNSRYGRTNIYQAGFEQIQKRTEDLKNLVVPYIGDTVADSDMSVDSNAVMLTLPSDYRFWVRGRAYITRTNCSSVWAPGVKLVKQDKLEPIKVDPFNKSRPNKPIIYFEEGAIKILEGDSFNVTRFQLTYIKNPAKVNSGTYGGTKVEFDLSEHTHKEIIEMAVDIALENIESRRIQTIQNQLQKIE